MSLLDVLGFYAQPDALLFTVSPADVITCEGCGQVMLTCGIPRQQTAANVPEPELQWMFNGSTVRHFVYAVVHGLQLNMYQYFFALLYC